MDQPAREADTGDRALLKEVGAPLVLDIVLEDVLL